MAVIAIPRSVRHLLTPAFRIVRSGGMDIEVPIPTDAIVHAALQGVYVGRDRSESGLAHFYDLEPGNYIATAVFGSLAGTSWRIVVTPTTYTVTRVSSTAIRTWGAQS